MPKVMLEMDTKAVCDALPSKTEDISNFILIIEDWRIMTRGLQFTFFLFFSVSKK